MKKLYYENQYTKVFNAKVVKVIKKENLYHICLDKTAFFPGGGGQFCDLGEINKIDVVDVYEDDKEIYHVVKNEIKENEEVVCEINWDRREDGMHQHFSQHILSGCFYKSLNKNTVSFHMGKDISTVDIQGTLSEEDIRKVEFMANEVIRENIKSEILTPNKNELKDTWIRRDLPDTDDDIRILKIGNLDTNACCGVHPIYTGEVRLIKIKKWEKHKNATRVEFLGGKRAVDEVLRRDNNLDKICKYLSCSDEEALKGIKNLDDKIEELLNQKKKVEEDLMSYESKLLLDNSYKIKGINIITKVYKDKDLRYINNMISNLTKESSVGVLIGIETKGKANLIFALSKDIKNIQINSILREVISEVDGRGGGNNYLAQGAGSKVEGTNTALEKAKEIIIKSI